MPLALADHWVWDFWIAQDRGLFHIFFLHAPKSLGDPELRHRNARIGHATSTDLRHWDYHGVAFPPGPDGTFDATATWTGSVVRGPDGRWWMFYTGSRFLSPTSNANIETVGCAVSDDFFSWTKLPGPALRADPTWYETLGSSSWPEEAWRDPWVFADPAGHGWHMLITARANTGPDFGRGVVGHAVSDDLGHWRAMPPLSPPQSGFAHLEVLQPFEIGGRKFLLFCCNSPRLANERIGTLGGIWVAPADGPVGPFDITRSRLLLPEQFYAGRVVQDVDGRWAVMAFEMQSATGEFSGVIADPIPLEIDRTGELVAVLPAPLEKHSTNAGLTSRMHHEPH